MSDLQGHINKLREMAKQVFRVFQASCIGTSNCHALSHVVNSIRQDGIIGYVNTSNFESIPKFFKKHYKNTFR